jgi:dihydrofolate reductase
MAAVCVDMTFTTAHMSISLDGFVAGPDQSFDQPLGRGGLELHRWHFESDQPMHEVDARWTAELLRPRGAYVMGRNMYGPVRGSWDTRPDWRGWWGDEPPYHAPVFVLTHHEHEPIEMEGGTTFHFVTGGFDEALAQAREAGDGDVDVAGGASAVRQAFASGELDELRLDIAPVLLGRGERIFDPDVTPTLELVEAEHSPMTTHVRYRVR